MGPWLTQMDEFLTAGESQIRNLAMGLGAARARGRRPSTRLHARPVRPRGQLPQFLRAFGIEAAILWRGVPGEIERTAFWWEAPDGSRVLTEYMVFGYFNGESFEPRRGAGRARERPWQRSVERPPPPSPVSAIAW